ncbi:hypothetical protein ILYODFUR_013216 [Ilyodon furcidens]|uniref:Uncharacterized protein n=1 Tax=Ilyodon furcidens TaxID=33524 RepID=A0ABV0T9E3_9TELE
MKSLWMGRHDDWQLEESFQQVMPADISIINAVAECVRVKKLNVKSTNLCFIHLNLQIVHLIYLGYTSPDGPMELKLSVSIRAELCLLSASSRHFLGFCLCICGSEFKIPVIFSLMSCRLTQQQLLPDDQPATNKNDRFISCNQI